MLLMNLPQEIINSLMPDIIISIPKLATEITLANYIAYYEQIVGESFELSSTTDELLTQLNIN